MESGSKPISLILGVNVFGMPVLIRAVNDEMNNSAS